MARPSFFSSARRSDIVFECWSRVPCEKFSRATSMPARTRRCSIVGVEVAGPIVQTILVRRLLGEIRFLFRDIGRSGDGELVWRPARRWPPHHGTKRL
jgi:hypothetical protein